MSSAQVKEFETFGIVNNKLKAGLMLGLLSLSLTINIYLVGKLITIQSDLYDKMLNRADEAAKSQTEILLRGPIENMNRAAARVDTAVNVTVGSAKMADSAVREIRKTQNKKAK